MTDRFPTRREFEAALDALLTLTGELRIAEVHWVMTDQRHERCFSWPWDPARAQFGGVISQLDDVRRNMVEDLHNWEKLHPEELW